MGKVSKLVFMHPVLKSSLDPLAVQIAEVSLEEAIIPPLPGQGRWCAQQVMEHLILTYEMTSEILCRQLKTGRLPKNRRNLLKFLLRVQTLGFGYMPDGVPAMLSVRPKEFTPQPGTEIARRFLEAAEEMDRLLVESRKRFGIQPCGEHPFFGVMRVDEWRRYHSLHARHHESQLRNAIRFARESKRAATS